MFIVGRKNVSFLHKNPINNFLRISCSKKIVKTIKIAEILVVNSQNFFPQTDTRICPIA